MSLNTVTIMGRVTKDVELRTTESGMHVANFSVAVDRDFQSGGIKREVDFFNCVAWKQAADFIQKHFQKGRMICLTGRMQCRKWTDKNGNNRDVWELVVNSAYFCGDRDSSLETGVKFVEEEDDGNLPF